MKVCVIGAGAAGIMCAITAAREGATVFIIEKNEKIGKKLYITGKGRCNVTNSTDFDGFMSNIVSNKKFTISALKSFDSEKCIAFFQSLGLPLKTERGNRVFPVSDKSSDVIRVLRNELDRTGVTLCLNETVTSLTYSNGKIISVRTNKGNYSADAIVVCTGGKSYPLTGSTGDGYLFAESVGHRIVPPVPSLCGFILDCVSDTNGTFIPLSRLSKLQGISLKNVSGKVVANNNNKVLFEEFGEMLFTEKGISGPIVLTLSAYVNRLSCEEYRFSLDLKPALTEKQLDDRLLRDFSNEQNKMFKNSLHALLPSGLIPFIVSLSNIPEEKPIRDIKKEERQKLISLLKNLTFSVRSLEKIDSAIVTAGGVSVKEIDPKTMRSKKAENLYFAGEVMDIDALTGGFNLQLAFATGYAAGKNFIQKGEKV